MIKRLFDIVFSVLGIMIIFPVFIIIIILQIIFTGKRIFFIQERVGRFGKVFFIIKFRTMNLKSNYNSVSIKGENRITKFGSFLRKYKIDEIPEIWNVLKGDMSFVGPRPDVPEYVNKLTDDQKIILNLRPGITGPASIKYKNEEEILSKQYDPINYYNKVIFPDKIRLNLNYIKYRNIYTDIKMILYTILGLNLKEEYYN